MIKNAILFYHNNDDKLKSYFFKCANFARTLLNMKSDIKQTCVNDSNCNFVYIDTVELPKHNEKSLFLIFSHGNEDAFYASNSRTPFIYQTINCDTCLNGGLVYTNACSTGIKFGKNLPLKNASYFGYDKDIDIWYDYEDIFVQCDNWGLYRLLQGDTLEEAKTQAKEKFNQAIDDLYTKNFLATGALELAKESIVIYGDISKSFL